MTRTEELLVLAENTIKAESIRPKGKSILSVRLIEPETIKQLVELAVLQNTALKESVDLVQQDYDEDWRHGLPSRAKQLAGKLELLNAHKESIAAFERFEKGGE